MDGERKGGEGNLAANENSLLANPQSAIAIANLKSRCNLFS